MKIGNAETGLQGPPRAPGLVELVRRGGVTYRLEGSNKEQVLLNLATAIQPEARFDREHLFSLLLAREGLGSTGVGEGLAIPQLVYPNQLGQAPASICLAFLERPVHFDSPDRRPVHCLLALVAPQLELNQWLLTRLFQCLRDPQLVQALRVRAGRDELTGHLSRIEAQL